MVIKKQILTLLVLLIASYTNSVYTMSNFGFLSKKWYQAAIFSSVATWYNSHNNNPMLCQNRQVNFKSEANYNINHINLAPVNPSRAANYYVAQTTDNLSYKEFDKKRDTVFLLECLQQDAYWFLSSNIKTNGDLYKLLEDANTVILYTNNTPVGFVIYSHGKINYLGVHKEHRGKGYATKLIHHIIDILKADSQKIILKVRPDNKEAIALYEKIGFKYKSSHGPYMDIYRLNTKAKTSAEIKTKRLMAQYAQILM